MPVQFGALSANAKESLGRASMVGTSTTTGDGGMTPEERSPVYNLFINTHHPRYGIIGTDDLRKADAIEIVLGQGANQVVVACYWHESN